MATNTTKAAEPTRRVVVEATPATAEPTAEQEPEQASMLVKLPAPLYHAFRVVALLNQSNVTNTVRDFVVAQVKAKRDELGPEIWDKLVGNASNTSDKS